MIIKIVTFALMAMFYVCYFTKMIAQKKQGINTDQLGKGKEGFIKFIEVTLKIATYLLPVIQVVSIVLYVEEEIQPLQILGAGIIAFGVLAFVLSVLQMKDNWILCVATGAALVLFHLQIVNVEEDFLLDAFGEDYLKYKKKVCRYIGRKKLYHSFAHFS